MDRPRVLRSTVVAVVLLAALASGPSVGVLEPTRDRPETVGDGNATVESVAVPDGVALEAGRFGTGVVYLRVPDARVNVADVSGQPKLRYHVDSPGLSVHESTTRVIDGDDAGTHRLAFSDRAFPPAELEARTYDVTLTVRVQSFDGDWTAFVRTTTVEVPR